MIGQEIKAGKTEYKLMGCELTEAEAEALVTEKFPGKPFCLVDGWTIVDLDVTNFEKTELAKKSLEPIVINALWVIHDSKGRFQKGTKVRSSFQRSLNDGYLFESQNTVYVLMGPGCRSRQEINQG